MKIINSIKNTLIGLSIAASMYFGSAAKADENNIDVNAKQTFTPQIFTEHPSPKVKNVLKHYGRTSVDVNVDLDDTLDDDKEPDNNDYDLDLNLTVASGVINDPGFLRPSQFQESPKTTIEQVFGEIDFDNINIKLGLMYDQIFRPFQNEITGTQRVSRPGIAIAYSNDLFNATLEQFIAENPNNGPSANSTQAQLQFKKLLGNKDTGLGIIFRPGLTYSFGADKEFAKTNQLENKEYPDFLELDVFVGLAPKILNNKVTGQPVLFAYGLDNVLAEKDGTSYVVGVNFPKVGPKLPDKYGNFSVKLAYIPEKGRNSTIAGFNPSNFPPPGVSGVYAAAIKWQSENKVLELYATSLYADSLDFLPFKQRAQNNLFGFTVDLGKLAKKINDYKK
tara:strand:+ start:4137 stop:5312 length:1176 start_codon:yes stop_codon:yes gene_type:complete